MKFVPLTNLYQRNCTNINQLLMITFDTPVIISAVDRAGGTKLLCGGNTRYAIKYLYNALPLKTDFEARCKSNHRKHSRSEEYLHQHFKLEDVYLDSVKE